MRVRSVQLGGSLAGKLSSNVSSILSSDVGAASGCGWRLRRAPADPCRRGAMDEGIMSPAQIPGVATDATGARGPRALVVLMIHLSKRAFRLAGQSRALRSRHSTHS